LGFDPLKAGHGSAALPTGPLIVLAATAVFLFSMFFAPRRGIAARAIELVRLRTTTARENLLRTMYELTEPHLPQRRAASLAELRTARAWSLIATRRLLRWSRRNGYVEGPANSPCLTEGGLAKAVAITRTHRLWELFLIQGVNVASDHVDRDADSIEHVLGPTIVAKLERALANQGRLPPLPGYVPSSPHDLPSQSRNSAVRQLVSTSSSCSPEVPHA
jgi:manganese/zinc/iron transport system permease protein